MTNHSDISSGSLDQRILGSNPGTDTALLLFHLRCNNLPCNVNVKQNLLEDKLFDEDGK
mgnify:CR=1 FL=1